MAQIDATVGGSYKVERSDRRVRVGIMDTGVDGTHPMNPGRFSPPVPTTFEQGQSITWWRV
jgi:hypothetical protein